MANNDMITVKLRKDVVFGLEVMMRTVRADAISLLKSIPEWQVREEITHEEGGVKSYFHIDSIKKKIALCNYVQYKMAEATGWFKWPLKRRKYLSMKFDPHQVLFADNEHWEYPKMEKYKGQLNKVVKILKKLLLTNDDNTKEQAEILLNKIEIQNTFGKKKEANNANRNK